MVILAWAISAAQPVGGVFGRQELDKFTVWVF